MPVKTEDEWLKRHEQWVKNLNKEINRTLLMLLFIIASGFFCGYQYAALRYAPKPTRTAHCAALPAGTSAASEQ